MELILSTSGVRLSLPDDFEPTVDYDLFSDKGENVVSILSGLTLPKNTRNKNLLSVSEQEQSVELKPNIGRSFYGKMNVLSESFNSYNDEIEIEITEKIKGIFKDIDIEVGELWDGTDFTWDFSADSDMPTSSTDGWFLTTADFNGMVDENDKVTLYPVRAYTSGSQMFWTISIKNLLNKIFTYYSVDFGVNGTLYGDTTYDETFIFFPATFVVDVDGSRDLSVHLDFYGGDNAGIKTIVTDNIEQATVIENQITGTASTKYSLKIHGTTNVKGAHYQYFYGGYSCNTVVTDKIINSSGSADAVLIVQKNGVVYKKITLGSLWANDGNGINREKTFSVDETIDITIDYNDEIIIFYGYEFYDYVFEKYHGYADGACCEMSGNECKEEVTINGVYSLKSLQTMFYDYNESVGQFTRDGIPKAWPSQNGTDIMYVDFTETERLLPLRRYNQLGSVTYTETINIEESIKKITYKAIDVIKWIVERYNLGFYMDSNGKVILSNYDNRYNSSKFVYLPAADEVKVVAKYNDYAPSVFRYSNNVKGAKSMKEGSEDNPYAKGDVVEHKQQTRGSEMAISLDTAVGFSQVYGKEDEFDDVDMLSMVDNARYWGGGFYERLEMNNIPIMIGYGTQPAVVDPRLPNTRIFNIADEGEPENWQPFVCYEVNGGYDAGDSVSLRMPTWSGGHGAGVPDYEWLGVGGELYTSGVLYPNFDPVINVNGREVYEIEVLITKEQLDTILDYGTVKTAIVTGTQSVYRVLSIEGFLYNRPASVVKMRLKDDV